MLERFESSLIGPWVANVVAKRREDADHDSLEHVDAHCVAQKGVSLWIFGGPFELVVAEPLGDGRIR